MRLVSALYAGLYPFNLLFNCDETVVRDPNELKQGDVLVLWGGEDISPALYNQGRSSLGHGDKIPSHRDAMEWALIQRAKELNIFIIGVCRGAQMLCAAAGGSLYQHVDKHGGYHKVFTHDNKEIMTNSLHHQMMNLKNTENLLLGWTPNRSPRYVAEKDGEDIYCEAPEVDPELVWFPNLNALAVQWHPEMTDYPDEGTKYLFSTIKEFK